MYKNGTVGDSDDLPLWYIDVEITWNYIGSGHGKCETDGEALVVKKLSGFIGWDNTMTSTKSNSRIQWHIRQTHGMFVFNAIMWLLET